MKSRAVRLTLFLLFVIAAGATAYLFWLGEARMRSEGAAARSHDAHVLAVIRDIDQLRSSQLAYVAAGQGDQFWAGKVATALTELKNSMERLRASSISTDAQAAADNALAILQDFERMDRRARDYARTGQRLLASDLIFSDGLELTAASADAIHRAGVAERQAQDETLEGVRRRQLYAMGSAAAAALLVILLLLPVPGHAAPAAAILKAEPATETVADSLEIAPMLEEGWSRAAPVTPPAPAPELIETQASAAPQSSVELASIASICSDLARVTDTRALPALLERSAATLDASGIVLWIADPDGRELSPIITHGYPASVVTRLGTILRDAENATAAALRTSLLQTVKSDAVSGGAIAAPLVTPSGCVGVMAAEVRNGGEQDATKLAAATIVAAQLATLVGPPSSKAHAEATG
ncbi:MAG: GAF domain-containing protein [Acidobacteria bacterium]|nr:GAF domain-containing protein [Acidobacteriota bacterium]